MFKSKIAIATLFAAALSACGPAPQPIQQPQVIAAPAQQAPAQPVVVQQESGGIDAGSMALGAMAGMALSGGGSRGSDYDRGYGRAPVRQTIINKTVVQKTVINRSRPATFTSRFASSSKSSSRVSLSKRRR
jgi:predicted lipid-binding transport protein (Tim44 family)